MSNYVLAELWECDGWELIDRIRVKTAFNFTMAEMFEYFVHRKAEDGLASNDFKDMNSRAYPLFTAGHIQYVSYKKSDDMVFVKCVCMAEMKKDVTYKIHVVF